MSVDADDWRIGDLALCVESGRGNKLFAKVGDHFYLENGDRTLRVLKGRIYSVANIGRLLGPQRALALGFCESAGPWDAMRFVKVTPPEADEFDREVIELMAGEPAEPQETE